MAGTLFLVATPIGNLEDVTLRALRVLREVDLIAAEDTRRTARLLSHYSISTPTTSLHEHNEHRKAGSLLDRIEAGASVALVSDAGMPLVSDPGAGLVKAARERGIRMEVVPGASAVTAAVAGAGIEGPFAFVGFAPASGRQRKEWMTTLGQITENMPAVAFEAPHRLEKTLADMGVVLGDRPIIAARELTKQHEEWVEKPITELAGALSSGRGEFVLVIPAGTRAPEAAAMTSDHSAMAEDFVRMTKDGALSARQAAKQLSQKYGVPSREIYARFATTRKDA